MFSIDIKGIGQRRVERLARDKGKSCVCGSTALESGTHIYPLEGGGADVKLSCTDFDHDKGRTQQTFGLSSREAHWVRTGVWRS